MKKRIKLARLGRTTSHRKSLVRNLVQALIRYGHVETTLAKAKVLKGEADRVVSRAKREENAEAKTRYFAGYFTDVQANKMLMDEIVPQFTNRVGGYTTIFRVRDRLNDGSVIARVEWVSGEAAPRKAKKAKVEATAKTVETSKEVKKPKKPAKVKKSDDEAQQ